MIVSQPCLNEQPALLARQELLAKTAETSPSAGLDRHQRKVSVSDGLEALPSTQIAVK